MQTIPDVVQEVNDATLFILIVSIIFLVGIVAFMLYCIIRFHKSKHPTPAKIEGHLGLELIWTIIPTIIVMVMFFWGLIGFRSMRTPPENSFVVKVTARQWSWEFEYPNGKKSTKLYVPLNQPIKCLIRSKDVLHSLYLPQYKIKEDAVPGMETYLWFFPDEKGESDIFCAEYCGDRHSYMLSKLVVMEPEDFKTWYNKKEVLSGADLVKQKGCTACHALGTQRLVGPGFKGLYGKKEVVITNGKERTVVVDDQYIRNSILHPNQDVVKGFTPAMPPQSLSDQEIQKVIEFLKGFK